MENNKVLDKCYVVYDEISKKYIGKNNINIYSKKPIYSDVPVETYKDIKFAKEFIFKYETPNNKLVIFEIDLLEVQSKNVLSYTPNEMLVNQMKTTLVDFTFYYNNFLKYINKETTDRYLIFVEGQLGINELKKKQYHVKTP